LWSISGWPTKEALNGDQGALQKPASLPRIQEHLPVAGAQLEDRFGSRSCGTMWGGAKIMTHTYILSSYVKRKLLKRRE